MVDARLDELLELRRRWRDRLLDGALDARLERQRGEPGHNRECTTQRGPVRQLFASSTEKQRTYADEHGR